MKKINILITDEQGQFSIEFFGNEDATTTTNEDGIVQKSKVSILEEIDTHYIENVMELIFGQYADQYLFPETIGQEYDGVISAEIFSLGETDTVFLAIINPEDGDIEAKAFFRMDDAQLWLTETLYEFCTAGNALFGE